MLDFASSLFSLLPIYWLWPLSLSLIFYAFDSFIFCILLPSLAKVPPPYLNASNLGTLSLSYSLFIKRVLVVLTDAPAVLLYSGLYGLELCGRPPPLFDFNILFTGLNVLVAS